MMKKYFLFLALLFTFFSSCRKDPQFEQGSIYEYFSGVVYKDCNGEVYKNEKVVLLRLFWGCFNSGVVDSIITYTDDDGKYYFKRLTQGNELIESTTGFDYKIILPRLQSAFSTIKAGDYDLYPNDTIMNSYVHLHFNAPFSVYDTFYYQLLAITEQGYGNPVDSVKYFTGPFNDTTIQLPSSRVFDVFENDSIHSNNAVFKFRIAKGFSGNYCQDCLGYITMTHSPCRNSDTLYYNVNIN